MKSLVMVPVNKSIDQVFFSQNPVSLHSMSMRSDSDDEDLISPRRSSQSIHISHDMSARYERYNQTALVN